MSLVSGRNAQDFPIFLPAMAGLVPAIRECGTRLAVCVDARHKAGHDD
jgi:hypothetical protein